MILKKILSMEKVEFNKLGPLPRVFEIIILKGKRDGKFVWGIFYQVLESGKK